MKIALITVSLLVHVLFSSSPWFVESKTISNSGIHVWPMPRNITWTTSQFTFISPDFTINTDANNAYLSAAISRYDSPIRLEHHEPLVKPTVNVSNSTPPLLSLFLTVADPEAPLIHGVDESYSLTIPTSGSAAYLTAQTVWGAMRGLDTFSQLVWGNPSVVPVGLYVWDAPLFEHRGIMLDTSRNYFPLEDILSTISAMSWNKLNVFHWHITDSHSFPLVVPSEPELARKGSYGPHMQYSPDDVRRIVEHGLENGVRVIPEIDSPGHTASWGSVYPEIVACANMFWWPAGSPWGYAAEPGTGQLNPLKRKTYQILKNVIHDVANMFPEPFYHGGADEVNPRCWETDPTIQSHLSKNGTLSELLEMFVNNTLPYIVSLNRTVVYWEDVLLDHTVHVQSKFLPKEHVILQTWNNGHNNTKKLVSSGYRTIVSSADFYYLDCGHGDFTGNNSIYDVQAGNQGNGGSWCGPYKTWQLIYNYDITYGLTEEEAKLVLGGEVVLWSEQADESVLDSRLWPRSSAMAEALWSGNRDESGRKRYGEATDRLNEWRYRMKERGVSAEPIQPMWCVRNPGMCNSPD